MNLRFKLKKKGPSIRPKHWLQSNHRRNLTSKVAENKKKRTSNLLVAIAVIGFLFTAYEKLLFPIFEEPFSEVHVELDKQGVSNGRRYVTLDISIANRSRRKLKNVANAISLKSVELKTRVEKNFLGRAASFLNSRSSYVGYVSRNLDDTQSLDIGYGQVMPKGYSLKPGEVHRTKMTFFIPLDTELVRANATIRYRPTGDWLNFWFPVKRRAALAVDENGLMHACRERKERALTRAATSNKDLSEQHVLSRKWQTECKYSDVNIQERTILALRMSDGKKRAEALKAMQTDLVAHKTFLGKTAWSAHVVDFVVSEREE